MSTVQSPFSLSQRPNSLCHCVQLQPPRHSSVILHQLPFLPFDVKRGEDRSFLFLDNTVGKCDTYPPEHLHFFFCFRPQSTTDSLSLWYSHPFLTAPTRQGWKCFQCHTPSYGHHSEPIASLPVPINPCAQGQFLHLTSHCQKGSRIIELKLPCGTLSPGGFYVSDCCFPSVSLIKQAFAHSHHLLIRQPRLTVNMQLRNSKWAFSYRWANDQNNWPGILEYGLPAIGVEPSFLPHQCPLSQHRTWC